jgi:hypothetical protein
MKTPLPYRLNERWRSAPAPAIIFGVGGLFPFVGLTLLIGIGAVERHDFFVRSLACYGAVILTFVGALHWGYAVRSDVRGGWSWIQYGWSILPSLVAWVSLMLPHPTGLAVQAAALIACFAFDKALAGINPTPAWLIALRGLLTIVAASALLTASYLA